MAVDGKLEENRLVGTTAGQVAAGSTLASTFYARRKHPVNLANLARLSLNVSLGPKYGENLCVHQYVGRVIRISPSAPAPWVKLGAQNGTGLKLLSSSKIERIS
jgi:hypothetical protein